MKKKILSIAVGAIGALLASGTAFSQGSDGPVFVPVDLFACSYNEGKGPADLDAAAAAWTEYADKEGTDSYAAWTLTKHYAGAEQDFDVIWVGAWKNANEMGSGMSTYLEKGGDVAAGFAAVMSCDNTANFASINPVAPPKGKTPVSGVFTFSDCTLKDGARNSDVGAAMAEWGKNLKAAGLETGIYQWYPVCGGGDADFTFKMVHAHANHTAFGKFYETMGNGGLYVKQQELFDDLLDCDVARAYNARNRRQAQVR